MVAAATGRSHLEPLAEQVVADLLATGTLESYSGALPRGARQALERIRLRFDDEAALEDLVAERLILLTRNAWVEEVSDEDVAEKVLTPSHERPVMVDLYSDFCRPCRLLLPAVYLLAAKYQPALKTVTLNLSSNPRFREAYVPAVQLTPSFLFFRHGRPIAGGWLARLLGQTAFVAGTRAGLERRIRRILR